jgi:iduronate 2-sulfatase
MDAQLGKVLAALHASGLANDTVVALFGDHGWHIGENNEWAKHTAMTRAAKVPLLVALLHNTGNTH